jgi:hypothetical protein
MIGFQNQLVRLAILTSKTRDFNWNIQSNINVIFRKWMGDPPRMDDAINTKKLYQANLQQKRPTGRTEARWEKKKMWRKT